MHTLDISPSSAPLPPLPIPDKYPLLNNFSNQTKTCHEKAKQKKKDGKLNEKPRFL